MKLKNLIIATAAALTAVSAQGQDVERPTRIRPLTTTTAAFLQSNQPNAQEIAALEFFRYAYPKGKVLTAEDVANNALEGIASLWIHCDRAGIAAGDVISFYKTSEQSETEAGNPDADTSNTFLSILTDWSKKGGNLYLSSQAVEFVYLMGRKAANSAGEKEFIFGNQANVVEVAAGATINISSRIDGANHAIFGSPIFKEEELANNKYIVQQFVPLTDNNDGIWPILASDSDAPIYYDNNNVLWAVPDQAAFNEANHCLMLGTWGHGEGHFADIYGIVEFLPFEGWLGNTITNGIAGCEWAPSTTSEAARAEGDVAVNKYAENLKRLTYNSVNYLTKAYNNAPTSAVADVEMEEAEGDAEYYTLQGVRVAEPATGLYIRRSGSKVEKVFVK